MTMRTEPTQRRGITRRIVASLAIVFGLATLTAGGQVLFGGAAAKAQAGQVVHFVLLFNFGAGFFYVLAGAATLAGQRWAVWVARGLALGTVLVLLAFAAHVLAGGAFEHRTLIAMIVRSAFWVAQALVLARLLRQAA